MKEGESCDIQWELIHSPLNENRILHESLDGFEVRQTWIQILASSFPAVMILSKSDFIPTIPSPQDPYRQITLKCY